MKKLIFALLALFMLSCSHDMTNFIEQQKSNFQHDFTYEYGKIAENHDWGFGFGTRSTQPNSNEWGTDSNGGKYKDYPKPADITEDELEAVLEVFNQKGAESYEALIDLQNFFVQQVYCGPEGAKMTELAAVVDYEVTVNVTSWYPYEADTIITKVDPYNDIVNNFNNGAYSGNTSQGCMLMFNSSTLDWTWKSTQGGGQRFHNWRMEYIPGYGYYVGFDFQSEKQGSEANENEYFERDYIYNDWIIKIVPGVGFKYPEVEKSYVRIIAEDLAASSGSDFDYNDVVFDAYVENGTAFIILQAAGGTVPLFIGGYEVHDLFNVNVNEMVNTGMGPNRDPVEFSFPFDGEVKDIPVSVYVNGNILPLKTEAGKAPEKICVGTDYVWTKEMTPIDVTYPKFREYVGNPDQKDWYHN